MSVDHRAYSRIPRHRTISIVPFDQFGKDGLWRTLTSVNVSRNGILFESADPYRVGEQYMIRFAGRKGTLYNEPIEIIRVEEVITAAHYNIGAAFLNEQTAGIKKLTTASDQHT